MKNISLYFFVIVYTSLFSALIFVGKEIFFPSNNQYDKYIEPSRYHVHQDWEIHDDFLSFSWANQEDIESRINKLVYEEFQHKYEEGEKDKVVLRFIPSSLEETIRYSYLPLAEIFLYKKNILSRIDELEVLLYSNKLDTRGRMKSGRIHLYGITQMSDDEFLSVLIHEFAHYYDIYSLVWNVFWDKSNEFYKISWESVNTLIAESKQEDFVSGYAITNQYEDFAESYVYYILHNKDFYNKSLQNQALARKYSFFRSYVFSQDQFYKTDFSQEENIQNYVWDITKLDVDVEAFLQYVQG